MPLIPPFAWVGILGIGGAIVYSIFYGDDDEKTPEIEPTPNPKPKPGELKPGPLIPAVPVNPGQSVTWNTELFGGGSKPMNWTAIRLAFEVIGWGFVDGILGGDPNGQGCPEPGKGSRSGCPANSQVKAMQAGINRAIDKANAGELAGSPLFAGLAKLSLDGRLGANTLRMLEKAGTWQGNFGGGPFFPGAFREATL